jgi:ABC-type polysaccharide/polyol phosphate export permease
MPGIAEHPMWRLTQMRLRELAREPGTLFWIFGFPLLMTIGLGLAFRSGGGAPLAVGLVQPAPPAWTATLSGAGFDVRAVPSRDEGGRKLATGALALVVLADEAAGGHGGVRYLFDPSREESRLARLSADAALQRAAGRVDAVTVHDEPTAEVGARYVDFLVPGLVGMNVMSGSMWAIGWAIVNLRVRKLLKRLLATPLRRGHLLASLILARLVVVPIEIASLLIFARLFFHVPVVGSLAALAAVSFLGALSFGGVAILVASRAQNLETVTGLMNAVMLPMFVLSGVFFSTAHFPEAFQPVIALLPLSALNHAIRGVMIDGAGLPALATPCAILIAWGAAGYALGLRAFRWS